MAQATLFTHRDYGIDGIHDFSADANLIGITVGGGLAFAATDLIVVRGEIRHTTYGQVAFAAQDGTNNGDRGLFDASNTTVEVGLSFKLK